MKASALQRVTELVEEHRGARGNLDRFNTIPDTAQQIHVLIRWPNPDPQAPPCQRELTFGMFIPFDGDAGKAIRDTIREDLVFAREQLAVELRGLGVEPDA